MRQALEFAVRRLWRRLLPEGARNSLRLMAGLEDRDRPPRRISRFDEPRVLVLAPHMDDEVLGCGGVLCRHLAAGGRATVVYMTDGRKGAAGTRDGSLSGAELAAAEARIVARRKAESRAASLAFVRCTSNFAPSCGE